MDYFPIKAFIWVIKPKDLSDAFVNWIYLATQSNLIEIVCVYLNENKKICIFRSNMEYWWRSIEPVDCIDYYTYINNSIHTNKWVKTNNLIYNVYVE